MRTRARASMLVSAAAFSVGLAWAHAAVACKMAWEPGKFEPSVKRGGVGKPPAPPELKEVLVQRSQRPPPGPGDCSEVGSFALVFALSDPDTAAQQLGITLKVIKGALPRDMTLTGGPYVHESGRLNFPFQDYPDAAFSFTLAARAVDATGNQSGPVEVVVEGKPQSSRSTGGCSMSGDARQSGAWNTALLLAVVLLRRRLRDVVGTTTFRPGGTDW